MEANIKVGASCTIKVTGESPVELIKGISQFSQLPTSCGQCGTDDLAFRHRTAGQQNEYDYLTLHCNTCGSALDIGQQKVGGGIFPRYNPKDASGNDKVNVKEGFYKWKDQPQVQSQGGGQQSHPQTPLNDSAPPNIPF